MVQSALGLGIDLGTSGVRACLMSTDGSIVAEASVPLDPPVDIGGRPTQAPRLWWEATVSCVAAVIESLRGGGRSAAQIAAISVDGTSGTLLLCDETLVPLTDGLMYNSGGFEVEARSISAVAPAGFGAGGPQSALGRLLALAAELPPGTPWRAFHQADWIAARLRGRGHLSDHNNALKLGVDPLSGQWPQWYAALGLTAEKLPVSLPPGSDTGVVDPALLARWGLSPGCRVVAGTTDSVAAWLAADVTEPGGAVTSLGTTLALKIVSPVRVEDAGTGCYSHRLFDHWLAGGASSAGAGVLRRLFSPTKIQAMTPLLRPDEPTGLDYYPLLTPGERFPVADPCMEPRLTPRPPDDRQYFQGLLESLARIERDAYRALQRLGAPWPTRVVSAGGGAANAPWREIRENMLGVPVSVAAQGEAAVGSARLALRALAE